jgi:hypothetical protein
MEEHDSWLQALHETAEELRKETIVLHQTMRAMTDAADDLRSELRFFLQNLIPDYISQKVSAPMEAEKLKFEQVEKPKKRLEQGLF